MYLGVLTFGVVSEQIKTRLEDSAERQDTKVLFALICYLSSSELLVCAHKRFHVCIVCWLRMSIVSSFQDVTIGKVVTTGSGLRYTDKRVGGGQPVTQGFLVILDYR